MNETCSDIQYHQYKFMWCKHALTYVIICGKGNRLKIHKWGKKQKITITVYENDIKTKIYVINKHNAKMFWKFISQLHKNFIYSKQHFKYIHNKNIMVNLYIQLYEDILKVVRSYADKNDKHRTTNKTPKKK